MTWRKLSDCQWAAAMGHRTYRILRTGVGYEAHAIRFGRCWVALPLGIHQSLAKAKRRCEAERIMG